MNRLLLIATLLTGAVALAGQTLPATATFSFHEDALGESIADWKAHTQHPYVNRCSDEYESKPVLTCYRSVKHNRAGLSAVDIAIQMQEEAPALREEYNHRLTVGGCALYWDDVHFDFYKGVLFRISYSLPRDGHQLIDAYKEAYGEPTVVDEVPLQNAYGATYTGQRLEWGSGDGRMLAIQIIPGVEPRVDVVITNTTTAEVASKDAPKKASDL